MKRIISVFIAAVLVLISVPCSVVFAETDGLFTYKINDGYATITDVDTSVGGEVIVPETLGGCPVTNIGDGVFKDNPKITSVTIPETVEDIGREAFMNCVGLTEVVIPDSVSIVHEAVFKGCTRLKKVTFGVGIQQLGGDAFEGCTEVTFYIYDWPSVARGYASDNGIPYETRPLPEQTAGDVTYDGKVTLADVSRMLKHIAGWNYSVDRIYGDVNRDMAITLSDVSLILKYIAGWDVTLG